MNALAGLRVVEVGRYVTAPEAAVLLGDLGADVIKIERPDTGDPFRAWGNDDYSPYFCSLNRNKRSVALDVTSPTGREALMKLLGTADVLIENFRAGQAERWGWGYETVRNINPQIIYCSITGFGSTGPYANRPCYDTVGQAMSGLLSLFTDLDEPQPVGISLSDHITGIYAAYGILGALLIREHTGVGQRVETSVLQSSVAFMSENIARFFASGEVPTRRSRARRASAFVLVARDGKPFVVHLSSPPKFWERFSRALGRPEWITDARFADRTGRRENYDLLDTLIRDVVATRDRDEWLRTFIDQDLPCGPLNTVAEAFEDPQVAAIGMEREIEHPVKGKVRLAAPGVALSDTPIQWRLPPPLLGEHTAGVLAEIGYSQEDIAQFAATGLPSDSQL